MQCFLDAVACLLHPFNPRDIYSGGIFVQIEKQGRNWRRTSWKKEGKRGEKKKKEKSDNTHVK